MFNTVLSVIRSLFSRSVPICAFLCFKVHVDTCLNELEANDCEWVRREINLLVIMVPKIQNVRNADRICKLLLFEYFI